LAQLLPVQVEVLAPVVELVRELAPVVELVLGRVQRMQQQ
jgi:hypothetical protein